MYKKEPPRGLLNPNNFEHGRDNHLLFKLLEYIISSPSVTDELLLSLNVAKRCKNENKRGLIIY